MRMTLLLGIVPSNRVLSTTLLFFISYIGLVCPIAQAQGCKQWTDVLLNGFMPRQDNLNSLRNMVDMSPDQYAQLAFNAEKKAAEQVLSTRVRIPAVEDQLRNALQRFYDVGYQLYGVRLDANNFFIISRMDPNAFATGSAIFLHKGLVDYYLNPTGYLVEIGFFPHSGYTVEQYTWDRCAKSIRAIGRLYQSEGRISRRGRKEGAPGGTSGILFKMFWLNTV